jgi:hypothetical protein
VGKAGSVLYSRRKRRVHVEPSDHVTACPKLTIPGMSHTSRCRLCDWQGLEPKADSPPGLNVYKYRSLPARPHPFPPIHTLSSYGDHPGESLPRPRQRPLTPCLRQHYLWAGGHFVLLISALRYFLATITLKAVSSWWYKGVALARPKLERAVADNAIIGQLVSLALSLAT